VSERQAKTLALVATFIATFVVVSRSVKKGGAFDVKGVIGVATWGGLALLVAGFAPELGAVAGALLGVDVLVLPSGSGPSAAELIGTFLAGGAHPSDPGGASGGKYGGFPGEWIAPPGAFDPQPPQLAPGQYAGMNPPLSSGRVQ
jgi:hypothetical protein